MSPDTLIHDSFVPKDEFYNDKYQIIAVQRLFCKVIYTNDQVFLTPKIFNLGNNEIKGNINEIGKYKSKLWEFQNEVRFRILIFPRKGSDNQSINFPEDLLKILNAKTPPPMDSYFLRINNLAFDKMQITLGPKCGAAEETIIHSLPKHIILLQHLN